MSCSMEMGGGCPPAPLVRDWVRVAQLSGSEAAKGKLTKVNFRDLEARRLGKHAHVRALRIVGAVKVTGGASHLAITRHAGLALIRKLQLSAVEGHNFLENLDGRSIEDAEFFRGGLYRAVAPRVATWIAANLNGTAFAVLELTIDLAGRVPGRAQGERLIPLAALQARQSEAFQFELASAFPQTTLAASVAVTDYYQPDQTTLGVEVWADVVWLDSVQKPSKWFLRNYQRVGNTGSLEYPEAAHLFAVVRPFAEDASSDNGEDDVEALSGVSVKVGGADVLSNVTTSYWLYRDTYVQKSEPESYAARSDVLSAYAIGKEKAAINSAMPFGMLLPARPRETAPAGRVVVTFGTNPAGTYRVLHEGVFCDEPSTEGKIRQAAGLKAPKRLQVDALGAPVAVPDGTVIDKTGPVTLIE